MSWDKPKSGPQWLVLFAPASICVLSTLAGGLIDPQDGNWMAWSIIGLLIATVSSFGLSIWLARVNDSPGAKIGSAIVCFIILMLVNGAVSFAGCAVGWSTLPTMSFH
jgi:hypothetical protein